MKIGCVVQRYGRTINGGAELHCRLVAEHLAERHEVEIFTTCAKDYVTWENYFPAGTEQVNNIPVHRFRVRRGRNIRRFVDIQNLVFHERRPPEYENRWIRENGPWCPKLVKAVQRARGFDAWVLFSYRYWTTVETLRLLRKRALLVPTAEHDPALYLGVFGTLFNLPGAIAYNTPEERSLIGKVSKNHRVPGEVVGVGLVDDPGEPGSTMDAAPPDPYVIYVGRIDKNKGCDHMFRMFRRFCREVRDDVTLALIGSPVIPIPDDPRIRHLGFVSEADKIRAIRNARLLLMPSAYESLSMVLLEAWRESRPALVNGKCEVLAGQCRRSNGGLVYNNYDEFAESLQFLLERDDTAGRIGGQGHRYYETNYNWPLIIDKYEKLFAAMSAGGGKGGSG